MIKFNCLIHKETGAIINYEDWLEVFKIQNKEYNYKAKEMLFNDDFEIIYESEFSEEEAILMLKGIKCALDENRIDGENNIKYINILRKFERDYPKSAEIQEEVQWMIEYFN